MAPVYKVTFVWIFFFSVICCHQVNTEKCQRNGDCYKLANNKSCVTVHTNRGDEDWFTSARKCEEDGGRLIWLHDTNIQNFTNHIGPLLQRNCTNCQFLWIGLMVSVYNGTGYFWKRTRAETVKQCQESISCTPCYANVNQSDCETLGCCYSDNSCRYPGNVTLDHSNEYAYSGHLRPYLDDRLRHCMGLQSAQSRGWVLRAVKCRDDNLLQNGYICEYKCSSDWPVPVPRQNISEIKTDTACLGDASGICPNDKCVDFPGRNSSLEVVHMNSSTNWFDAARQCENNRGRLVWLYDKIFTDFITKTIPNAMSTYCPYCTIMWLGLMQSTFNDTKFFWKRTVNETLQQCNRTVSNITCERNATKEQCELLGCCFTAWNSCVYSDDYVIDSQHLYKRLNGKVQPGTGYRRCAYLITHDNAHWNFAVEDCFKSITTDHGYICEYKSGDDWPTPAPKNATTYPSKTTIVSPSKTSQHAANYKSTTIGHTTKVDVSGVKTMPSSHFVLLSSTNTVNYRSPSNVPLSDISTATIYTTTNAASAQLTPIQNIQTSTTSFVVNPDVSTIGTSLHKTVNSQDEISIITSILEATHIDSSTSIIASTIITHTNKNSSATYSLQTSSYMTHSITLHTADLTIGHPSSQKTTSLLLKTRHDDSSISSIFEITTSPIITPTQTYSSSNNSSPASTSITHRSSYIITQKYSLNSSDQTRVHLLTQNTTSSLLKTTHNNSSTSTIFGTATSPISIPTQTYSSPNYSSLAYSSITHSSSYTITQRYLSNNSNLTTKHASTTIELHPSAQTHSTSELRLPVLSSLVTESHETSNLSSKRLIIDSPILHSTHTSHMTQLLPTTSGSLGLATSIFPSITSTQISGINSEVINATPSLLSTIEDNLQNTVSTLTTTSQEVIQKGSIAESVPVTSSLETSAHIFSSATAVPDIPGGTSNTNTLATSVSGLLTKRNSTIGPIEGKQNADTSTSLAAGAIAGIVVGALFFLGLVFGAVAMLIRWRSKSRVGIDLDDSTRISMTQSQPINVNVNMEEKADHGTPMATELDSTFKTFST